MKKPKIRKIMLEERETITLHFAGRRVAELEFDVPEQKLTLSVYGDGAVANPILLSVDTQMLGWTENDNERR